MKNIIDYIKSLGVVKKESVLQNFDNTIDDVNDRVLPLLNNLKKTLKELGIDFSDNGLETLKELNQLGELKARDVETVISYIERVFENFKSNSSSIKSSIDDINDGTTASSISPKELSTLKVVSDLYFLDVFCYDIVKFTIDKLNGVDIELKGDRKQEMVESLITFGKLINFYLDNKNYFNEIKKMSNERLNLLAKDDSSFIFGILNRLKNKFSLYSGFVGNPIYHIRIFWAEISHKTYERNKESKVLLEKKLLKLKMKRKDGEDNASLDKQIDYYEEKLNKLEYSIRTYEED